MQLFADERADEEAPFPLGKAITRYTVPIRYRRPGDPRLDLIGVLDAGTNIVYHGPTIPGGAGAGGSAWTNSISWTPQFRAAVSYVAGAHALKVGFNEPYLKAHDSCEINNYGYGRPGRFGYARCSWPDGI